MVERPARHRRARFRFIRCSTILRIKLSRRRSADRRHSIVRLRWICCWLLRSDWWGTRGLGIGDRCHRQYDFVGSITLDAFSAGVPAHDTAFGVEHVDRIIHNATDQEVMEIGGRKHCNPLRLDAVSIVRRVQGNKPEPRRFPCPASLRVYSDRTSRSAVSALSNCDRIGTAASNAGAPCSISSPARGCTAREIFNPPAPNLQRCSQVLEPSSRCEGFPPSGSGSAPR